MNPTNRTITFRTGSQLHTIPVQNIEKFYFDSNNVSTYGTTTVSKYFKLYYGQERTIRLKICQWAKENQEKKTDVGLKPGEHELKTENIRSALELLSELKRVSFLSEHEYNRYLKEVEKAITKYSEWKTEEIGFKLDEELNKLKESGSDQDTKKTLMNIEELLEMEDEMSLLE